MGVTPVQNAPEQPVVDQPVTSGQRQADNRAADHNLDFLWQGRPMTPPDEFLLIEQERRDTLIYEGLTTPQ